MGHIYRSTDKKLPRELRSAFDDRIGQKRLRHFGEDDGAIVKAFDEAGEMIVSGIANLAKPDRWNEIIVPEAWDIKNYLKNPIILREHNRMMIIGKATKVEIKKDGLYYVAQIGDPRVCSLTECQTDARSLLAQGLLKTNSVGFVPLVIEYDEEQDVLRYTSVELLEISIVSIPMQQDSVITSVKSWKGKTMEKEIAALQKSVDAQGEALKTQGEVLKAVQSALVVASDATAKTVKGLQDEVVALKAAAEASAKEIATLKSEKAEVEAGANALLAKLTETGAIKAAEPAPAAK